MILVDYVVNTYHYWVCGFKVRFLGAEKHDIGEHFTDDEWAVFVARTIRALDPLKAVIYATQLSETYSVNQYMQKCEPEQTQRVYLHAIADSNITRPWTLARCATENAKS